LNMWLGAFLSFRLQALELFARDNSLSKFGDIFDCHFGV